MWFVSDTHFGHGKILGFVDDQGGRIRPQFESCEAMDEMIIDRWNEVVKDTDKIYHLGDFIMGDRSRLRGIVNRLHGRKRLIVGNHDDVMSMAISGLFEKVLESRTMGEYGFLCTHRPVLMENGEDRRRSKIVLNVHGHIHQNPDPSPRHMNVCVERTDYRPVHLDEILAKVKRLKESHHESAPDA